MGRRDGASNRYWVKVGSAAAVTTVFDDSSHPVSSSDGTSYTVDAVGNLTKIDRSGTSSDWVFSYDSYSRQACARQASTTCSGTGAISYLLDPFGRASSRTKGSSVTAYTYRGLEETLAKTVAGSTTMTYAATPSGTPLAQQKNSSASSTRYFLTDPHSDLVGLVSSSASSKGTTSFDPWGTKLSSSGTETSVLGFQSDLTDPDSGLVDMGTRWYAASLGRFTSRDALFGQVQAPVSLNQHIYGLQNPITMWDPTGMSATPGVMRTDPVPIPEPPDSLQETVLGDPCDAYCQYSALAERPDVFMPLYGVTLPPWVLISPKILGGGTDFLSTAFQGEADYIFGNSGLGFSDNAGAALYEAKAFQYARWAKYARWAGGVFTAAGAWADWNEFRAAGHSRASATVGTVVTTTSGLAGAATGAWGGGAVCAATGVGIPFAPLCAGVGAVAGGLGASRVGKWLYENFARDYPNPVCEPGYPYDPERDYVCDGLP